MNADFKIFIRKSIRNKYTFLINVFSLVIAMAVFFAAFMVIRYQLSFDTFHKKYDRIHRIVTCSRYENGADYIQGVPYLLPGAINNRYGQIEEVAPVMDYSNSQVAVKNGKYTGESENALYNEKGIFFMGPSFFKIFDFSWLQGSPNSSLGELNQTVLTKSIAEKYFGTWMAAMGQTIVIENKIILTVSGIINDPPSNTDFPLQILVSYKTYENLANKRPQSWEAVQSSYNCYILLRDAKDEKKVAALIANIGKTASGDPRFTDTYLLQPLNDLHFSTRFGNYNTLASKKQLWVIALIAISILAISCINFINITSTQSLASLKQAGIKRVFGESRRKLVFSLMQQTAFVILTAFIITGVLLICLPVTRLLFNVEPPNLSIIQPGSLVFVLFSLLLLTILSGMYPSWLINKFRPIQALKFKLNSIENKGGVRKGLIVVQLIMSQALLISLFVVVKQVHLLTNASIGFNAANIVTIDIPGDSASRRQWYNFKYQLLQQKDVRSVSLSNNAPLSANYISSGTFRFDNATRDAGFEANIKVVDKDYFSTYSIPLVAGEIPAATDSIPGYLVNETLVSKLGTTPGNIIGKSINLWDMNGIVSGVVRDFNTLSLRKGLEPVILCSLKRRYRIAGVKTTSADLAATMAEIKTVWNKTFVNRLFSFHILKDEIEDYYQSEKRMSLICMIAAMITMFVTCLSLYGLMALLFMRKEKEMGVRKALGASAGNILRLLLREPLTLYLISSSISIPASIIIMQDWLNGYVSRIHIGPGLILGAVLACLLIILFTISFHSIRSMMLNPVKVIRNE